MEKYIENLGIDVMAIIVDDWSPKSGKQAIIKGSDGRSVIIKAIDKIEGYLFGTVVDASVKDADDHKITNKEVEKSCHNYQRVIMEKGFKADINHNKELLKGVELVENYVDRSKADYSHNIVLNFSENKTLMEKAKNSKIKGLSPKGRANIIEKGTDKGTFEKAFDKITSVFNKEKKIEKLTKGVDMTTEKLQALAEELKVLTDDELKEIGLQRIVAPEKEEDEINKAKETSKVPAKETSKAPENAELELVKAQMKTIKAELELVKAQRITGPTEEHFLNINAMSETELQKAKEDDPDGYEKALEELGKKQ